VTEISPSLVSSKKFIFISLKNRNVSRTKNYYLGLKKSGFSCEWFDFTDVTEFLRQRRRIGRLLQQNRQLVFVITSPSHVLTLPFILAFRRRAILDAGWPLYDGIISSRRRFGVLGQNLIKTLFIDLTAFHLSKLVILETEEQLKWVSRHYLLRKSKLTYVYTGFIEDRIEELQKPSLKTAIGAPFGIVFRGGNQVEAGLTTLETCCALLANEPQFSFKIISNGLSQNMFSSTNVQVFNEYLADDRLYRELSNADITIGQLSNHNRLTKTLPHKFFEAGYFKVPYLSADFGIMSKYVKAGTIIGTKPNDPMMLAENLRKYAKNRSKLENYGQSLHEWYLTYASQKVLTLNFLNEILKN